MAFCFGLADFGVFILFTPNRMLYNWLIEFMPRSLLRLYSAMTLEAKNIRVNLSFPIAQE